MSDDVWELDEEKLEERRDDPPPEQLGDSPRQTAREPKPVPAKVERK